MKVMLYSESAPCHWSAPDFDTRQVRLGRAKRALLSKRAAASRPRDEFAVREVSARVALATVIRLVVRSTVSSLASKAT